MPSIEKSPTNKRFAQVLTGTSLVALIASFWQAAERIHMLKDPGLDLSCNLNPIVDCGGVMSHKLAALFGFPNTFIGMVMFSMLAVTGIYLLLGNSINKKAQHIILGLSVLALGFSFWFFGVSLYIIGKICLFCLAIWPSTIIMFWYVLLDWLEKNASSKEQKSLLRFGKKHRYDVIIGVFALMALLYFYRFREFYF